MPLYDTPAGTIETLEWGSGAELLILLHAAASSPQALGRLAKRLVRPDRRIVAPMLNGYGRTTITASVSPIEAHLAVATACVDLFTAKKRVLLGHSMGGLIALLCASRNAPPDALVLYEPIVIGALDMNSAEDSSAYNWDHQLVETLAEKLAAGDPETGVAGFIEGWNEAEWSAIPEAARARLVAAAPVLAAETRAVHGHAIAADEFSGMTSPVLLLQGTASPDLANRIVTRLLRRLPKVRRMVLGDLGHMGPALAPDPVAGAVDEFLRRELSNPAT